MRDAIRNSSLLSDRQKRMLAEMRRRWRYLDHIVVRAGIYKAWHRRRIRRAHLADPDAWTGEDPYAVVMVPAKAVRFVMNTRFHKREDAGRIVDGDWDRDVTPFEEMPLWQACVARFRHGRPWEETAFVRTWLERVAAGEVVWHGCRTAADVHARCRKIDALYESIARRGLRRLASVNPFSWRAALNELTLNIGRDGTLIRNCSGMHRLCIARIQGIETVPALILVRHRAWHARQKRQPGAAGMPGRAAA